MSRCLQVTSSVNKNAALTLQTSSYSMSDNGSSQTEGQVDGRPANLTYGPGDHGEETVFSWTEGDHVIEDAPPRQLITH